MIEGVVNAAYEQVIALAIHGPSGQAVEIEAVIDTGFTGFLTVTPALAAGSDAIAQSGLKLNLPLKSSQFSLGRPTN